MFRVDMLKQTQHVSQKHAQIALFSFSFILCLFQTRLAQ